LAKLEGVQEDANMVRILSIKRERMIRLNMQLTRVKGPELRIEMIRDQVRRIEGGQDSRTRAMLEESMKTAMATASMVTTPKSSSSSPLPPPARKVVVKKAATALPAAASKATTTTLY